jgi:hypothetical protein
VPLASRLLHRVDEEYGVVSSGWIDRAEALKRLQQQAGGLAAKLGHRLGAWSGGAQAGATSARCQQCGDVATVRARHFGAAAISGAAVELRCAGGAPPPAGGARGGGRGPRGGRTPA